MDKINNITLDGSNEEASDKLEKLIEELKKEKEDDRP